MVVYRQESPVVFVNARRVTDRLRRLAGDGIEVVAFDATAVSSIDSTGFEALLTIRDEFEGKGIELGTINPSVYKSAMFDQEAEILGVKLPPRFRSLEDVLDAFQARTSPADIESP